MLESDGCHFCASGTCQFCASVTSQSEEAEVQHVRHVPLLPIRDRGRSRSPRRRASLSNRVQPSGGAPDTPTQVVLRGWVHPESRGPQQPRLHRALLGTPTFNRNEIGLVRSPLSGLQMWGFPALLPQTKLDHLRASLPIDFPLRDREFQKLLMELQQLKEQSSGRLSLSWSSRSMNDRQHACEVISTSCQRARERTGTIPWLYMGAWASVGSSPRQVMRPSTCLGPSKPL